MADSNVMSYLVRHPVPRSDSNRLTVHGKGHQEENGGCDGPVNTWFLPGISY